MYEGIIIIIKNMIKICFISGIIFPHPFLNHNCTGDGGGGGGGVAAVPPLILPLCSLIALFGIQG